MSWDSMGKWEETAGGECRNNMAQWEWCVDGAVGLRNRNGDGFGEGWDICKYGVIYFISTMGSRNGKARQYRNRDTLEGTRSNETEAMDCWMELEIVADERWTLELGLRQDLCDR